MGLASGLTSDGLCPPRVAPDLAPAAKDPEVLSTDALKPGKLIRGYVMSAGDQGVLVR